MLVGKTLGESCIVPPPHKYSFLFISKSEVRKEMQRMDERENF